VTQEAHRTVNQPAISAQPGARRRRQKRRSAEAQKRWPELALEKGGRSFRAVDTSSMRAFIVYAPPCELYRASTISGFIARDLSNACEVGFGAIPEAGLRFSLRDCRRYFAVAIATRRASLGRGS